MIVRATNGGFSTDVVIVGGGPVGLSMALHLDSYGINSILVETEPTTRWHPKGNTINARTMELFRRLGLADQIRRLGVPADHPFDVAYFTRFSGFEIARGRTPSSKERLDARRRAELIHQVPEPPHRANQMFLERFLMEQAAVRKNITLKFGHTAETFAQDEEGVTLTVRKPDGGKESVRARYLVGCDGPHGLVRRALGIRYGGEAKLMGVFMSGLFTSVHLRIPDLYPRFVGHRPAWMYYALNPDVQVVMITLNGGDEFMMHIPTKANDDMSVDTIIKRVKTAIGSDIEVSVISHRQWHAGAYLVAERYQSGRVFIAGDAAHLYTPTGGFGMNTGIDDTSNLAWKIAAVEKGWGSAQLLNTYETERRPAALRSTTVGRRLGKTRVHLKVPPVAEEDFPAGEKARNVIAVSEFITDHHFNKPEETDWLGVVLGTRYDASPIIVGAEVPPEDSQERYSPSNIPGSRAPHLWLDDGRGKGSSLYDHFGEGFTLLRFGRNADISELEAAAKSRHVPLHIVHVPLQAARTLYDRDLFLVRSDGYLAWKGNQPPANPLDLIDTLRGAKLSSTADVDQSRKRSGTR